MKKWFIALSCILLSAKGFAALAPNHQMAREVCHILCTDQVMCDFPEGVSSIERTLSGYILVGDGKRVLIDIDPITSNKVYGPKNYKLRIHEVQQAIADSLSSKSSPQFNQEFSSHLREILNSSNVSTQFPMGVRLIEREVGGYVLQDNGQSMKVDVIALPDDGSHPTKQYKFRYHQPRRVK